MNEQQIEVLGDIYNTLIAVSDDVATEYKHKFEEGGNEWYETVSREKHLESIIQWAVQQIENNFEIEEKNTAIHLDELDVLLNDKGENE